MSATPSRSTNVATTVAVRPRLDLRYDVIQSHAPQLVGSRATKDDAIKLGQWAAEKNAPCTLIVFGPDGATIESSTRFDGAAHPATATP